MHISLNLTCIYVYIHTHANLHANQINQIPGNWQHNETKDNMKGIVRSQLE